MQTCNVLSHNDLSPVAGKVPRRGLRRDDRDPPQRHTRTAEFCGPVSENLRGRCRSQQCDDSVHVLALGSKEES